MRQCCRIAGVVVVWLGMTLTEVPAQAETIVVTTIDNSEPGSRARRVLRAGMLAATALQNGAVQEASRTVWDGVYSEQQARRGEDVYRSACALCHQDDLRGGTDDDSGPALLGARFLGKWWDGTLLDLFEKVRTTMPADAPGSLSPADYADVLSFILEQNEMPNGRMDLPPDAAVLRAVRVVSRP